MQARVRRGIITSEIASVALFRFYTLTSVCCVRALPASHL